MSPDSPRAFFILNMLQNSSARRTTIEIYVEFGCPLPEKNCEYATNMKTFFKGLIYAFFGSSVFVFS